jgi:hypothetical protein
MRFFAELKRRNVFRVGIAYSLPADNQSAGKL